MRRLGALIFPGFEMLDLYGPLQMLGLLREHFAITLIAEQAGAVPSNGGPQSLAERSLGEVGHLDMLLVPGGAGTRKEVENERLTSWLAAAGREAEIVASVCTGAALLARGGLLDGRRATTNKRAWAWATAQGPKVDWQAKARWVEDGPFWTSSGVAAGIDMALGLIASLVDEATAEAVATGTEYEWHRDRHWDPFATLNGLAD